MVCCSFLPSHRFAEDRTVLGDASQQLWAFLSHPRTFSSSAWALGLILKCVGAPKSFGPTNTYDEYYVFVGEIIFSSHL